MRVIILTYSGVAYAVQLANALAKSVDLMFMVPERVVKEFVPHIDDTIRLKFILRYSVISPKNLISMRNIVKEVESYNPDVIHVRMGFPWLMFAHRFIKKYPIVSTFDDPELHIGERTIRARITLRNILKYSDRFITHGKILKRKILDLYPAIPPDKIDIIPHGDSSIFRFWSKACICEEPHTVLFFGRIYRYKGLEYLIKAEPLIANEIPDVKIIIAGKGEDIKEYKKLMTDHKRYEVYNEYLPNSNVAELFQRASIVVLPYIEASQSGVLSLAYTFNKPVVATNVGGLPEVVENGKTGYLIPPKNSEKLAEAIVELLRNPREKKRMGENAYRKAKKEYSWDKIAEKHIQLYKKILEN